MAIVKFVTSDCPVNNIFPYVTRNEATEQRLISGIECSPNPVLAEIIMFGTYDEAAEEDIPA